MSRTPEQGPQLHRIVLVCYEKNDWDNLDTDSIISQMGHEGFDDWIGSGAKIRCTAVYPTGTMEISTAEEVAGIFGDNL